MNKLDLLNTEGNFTWFWGKDWFIETDLGNFHWSDPSFPGGTDTIKPFSGGIGDFCEYIGHGYGRGKGTRTIRTGCGNQFELIGF